MQKCQNCQLHFSWSEIYRVFLSWAYKPVICDHCGVKHKITFPSRLIFVSFTILPMLLFINYLTPFNNPLATLGVGLCIFSIGSLFMPYFVKFKVV